MLDSANMSCTLSEEAEWKLKASGVALTPVSVPESVVFVDCAGHLTQLRCIYVLKIVHCLLLTSCPTRNIILLSPERPTLLNESVARLGVNAAMRVRRLCSF